MNDCCAKLDHINSSKKCNFQEKNNKGKQNFFRKKKGRTPSFLSDGNLLILSPLKSSKYETNYQGTKVHNFFVKKQGCTQKFIAEAIGVHKSTISRELRRNVTEKGNYSYKVAQELADIRKLRLKEKRKFTPEVKNRIERYMREKQWSPEQIVGYCKNKGYAMVSVETIYKFIRQDQY